MAVIVADTDVLIDALAGEPAAVAAVTRGLDRGVLATTALTAFDLLSGARTADARERIEALLAPLRVLPLDDDAARAAAARRRLAQSGTPIGMADYLIAGTCLAHAASLFSRNREHFERVPGLVLAEP